ncbi:hypothetical protein SAMN04515674_11449 [Pseudarcicella hirudinis]|uniref:Uncharacterized protein n=1 Tax=Pseudarcicella hirudinis TaxID=1079859 RepID=A0A1I5XBQ8_9BACT|nr:hypothetical protein SAMN04515674_11449 [Pseudarcicella hirudinis]
MPCHLISPVPDFGKKETKIDVSNLFKSLAIKLSGDNYSCYSFKNS